jgi:hypothetical protein
MKRSFAKDLLSMPEEKLTEQINHAFVIISFSLF